MSKAYESLGLLRWDIIRSFGEHSPRPYKSVAAAVEKRLRISGQNLGDADFAWIFHLCTYEKFFSDVPGYSYDIVRLCFVEVCVSLGYKRKCVNRLIDEWESPLMRRRMNSLYKYMLALRYEDEKSAPSLSSTDAIHVHIINTGKRKRIAQQTESNGARALPSLDNIAPNYSLHRFRPVQIVILKAAWWEWYSNNHTNGSGVANSLELAGSEWSIANTCVATQQVSWTNPIFSLRNSLNEMRAWSGDYICRGFNKIYIRPDLFSYVAGGDGAESNRKPAD